MLQIESGRDRGQGIVCPTGIGKTQHNCIKVWSKCPVNYMCICYRKDKERKKKKNMGHQMKKLDKQLDFSALKGISCIRM